MMKKRIILLLIVFLYIATPGLQAQQPGGIADAPLIWYRADKGVTSSGTSLTGWVNQGTLTPSGFTIKGSPQTTGVINFNQAFKMNGTSDYLYMDHDNEMEPLGFTLSLFGAVRPPERKQWNPIMVKAQTASWDKGYALSSSKVGSMGFSFGDWTGDTPSNVPFTLYENQGAVPYISTGFYTDTNARENIRVNAGNTVSNNQQPANYAGSGEKFYMAGDHGSWYFAGQFGEAIMYNTALTETQRHQIESYLAIKYGITLGGIAGSYTPTDYVIGTTGTVVWKGSSQASYHHNVFGLARLDASALHQRISKSEAVGGILLMSTDNNFTNMNVSGSSGHPDISADASYLMVGDNADSYALTSSNVAPGYNKRIARQWLVNKNNFNQQLYLKFNWFADNSSITWYLVKRNANENLTTNVTEVVALDGNGVTASAITLNDGDYFTLMAKAVDSDNDGLPDIDDLDDDNDGIMDKYEYAACPVTVDKTTTVITSSFDWNSTGDLSTYIKNNSDSNQAYIASSDNGTDITNLSYLKFDFSNTLPQSYTIDAIQINVADKIFSTGSKLKVQGSKDGGTNWADLTPDIVADPSSTGAVTSVTNKAVNFTFNNQENYNVYRILGVSGTTVNNYVQEVYLHAYNPGCDTDGDGIPNRLDLDSDNDGCVDAIEGDENVTQSQLIDASSTSLQTGSSAPIKNLCVSSCVDSNGVPIIVNSSGAADIGGDQGQGLGYSQNNNINACNDSDGDGIVDVDDLDNDNDGIMDTDEACPVAIKNTDFTPIIGDITWYNNSVSKLNDNDESNNSYTNPDNQGIMNKSYLTFKMNLVTSAYVVTGIQLNIDTNEIFTSGSTLKVQGSNDNSTWTDVSGPISGTSSSTGAFYTISSGKAVNFTFSNRVAYTYYRLYGVQGTARYNWQREVHLRAINMNCDTDGDGTPNRLDLDSDNDGCLDALEGDENVTGSQLVTAVGTVTSGTGSSAPNQNLCASGSCIDAQGVPTVVNTGGAADISNDQGQGVGSSANSSINSCPTYCYKPGAVASVGNPALNSKIGITSLNRAGAAGDNWPAVRIGAWLVLEAKTKGFVPNRMAFSDADNNPATPDVPVGIALANFVEGMLVYDSTNKCMKMYTSQDGGITFGWYCISTQTCPD